MRKQKHDGVTSVFCRKMNQNKLLQKANENKETKNKDTDSGPSTRCSDVSVRIPPEPVGCSNLSPDAVNESSSADFFRTLSLKMRTSQLDGERSCSLLDLDHKENPETSAFSDPASTFTWKSCTSLPITLASNSSPQTSTNTLIDSQMRAPQETIPRSLSVPEKVSFVVRSPSLASRENHATNIIDGGQTSSLVHEEQEIPEEEAVCRICFDTCEDRKTLKMECSCKGELEPVHEDCAIKWYSLKGNRLCEVCETMGFSSIIACFLIGSMFPRGGKAARTFLIKLSYSVHNFILPVYFGYTGFKADVTLINSF